MLPPMSQRLPAAWSPRALVRANLAHPCHGAPVVEGVYAPGCSGVIRAGEFHLRYNPGGHHPQVSYHCPACVAAFFDAVHQPRWDAINEMRPA
jgi:hypothetical protein